MRRVSKGFSLVEIMVALVIGMLGIMVMMQVFAVSEGQKRTTTGGNDAQTNGLVALQALEREARTAGYGFATLAINTICPAGVSMSASGTDYTLNLAPLAINAAGIPAGDANTSTISVAYGSSGVWSDGIGFDQVSAMVYKLQGRFGFNLGDLVLATPTVAGPACTLSEVVGLPAGVPLQCGTGGTKGAAAATNEISVANETYEHYYSGCIAGPSDYNKAAGWGVLYSGIGTFDDGKLYNLGPQLTMRVFAVRQGRLTVCNAFANNNCTDPLKKDDETVWTPIADSVVSLRAVYGSDTNDDGVAETWSAAAPTDLAQVRGVMVAVVTRSNEKAKPDAGGNCSVTSAAPTWAGDTEAPIDLSALADWQCYRYKLFQTTIPLRSMIWRGQ